MKEMKDNKNIVRPMTDDLDFIRKHPSLCLGRWGDGSFSEDAIYMLLKEVLNNSVEEFRKGHGSRIEVKIKCNNSISVRDYGRGCSQNNLIKTITNVKTGWGLKYVNAMSSYFEIRTYQNGKMRMVVFERGQLKSDMTEVTKDDNGTYIIFQPDKSLFSNLQFDKNIIKVILQNYAYLNTGLTLIFNGRSFFSHQGLKDLLSDRLSSDTLYPIIHLKGKDIEIAFTHTDQYGEELYSFVNGQYTYRGGIHQESLRRHIASTLKNALNIDVQENNDCLSGIVAAISIKVEKPIFVSSAMIELGSVKMSDGGPRIFEYVGDFVRTELDTFLHTYKEVADAIEKKIKINVFKCKTLAGCNYCHYIDRYKQR